VIAHEGGVNRIRAMKQLPYVVATWSDTGKVHMWDVKEHFDRLDTIGAPPNPKTPPLFTFTGHADEGFAMDFNPHVMGRFVSGDCKKYIYLWQPTEGGWAVDDVSCEMS
jgi:ribosome assembly protein RRB1